MTMIFKPILMVLCGLLSASAVSETAKGSAGSRWLISDVVIVDGSGEQGFKGSVRVVEGVITGIGDLQAIDGEMVIRGNGLTLAPGFIDTHSHADEQIMQQPAALSAISQGITTVIVGQDGGSAYPLAEWFKILEGNPAAVNIASYAGHNTLRSKVMGADFRRPATAAEIETMSAMLKTELEAGALGFGTGLEYEPGIHSISAEVISLAKIAAKQGGRYISHLRSEDRWLLQALDEIIEIGRVTGMPVQVSHIKLAMKSLWGMAPEVIGKLDAARQEGIDITADIYPYTYWQANMMVLIPSRDLNARDEYEFALNEITPAEGFWLTRFDPQPEYIGKKLSEIAVLRGTDPVTTMMQLTAESVAWGEGADTMIGTSMTEEDIRQLFTWPHANLCTDGSLDDLHPRGSGSFPRVLGRYVREQKLMSLEEAVHKMSGLSASHMGMTRRGLIRPGMAADLVLFDPDTVMDHATPAEPQAHNSGIISVWVNGTKVFDNGAPTGQFPGHVIRRQNL